MRCPNFLLIALLTGCSTGSTEPKSPTENTLPISVSDSPKVSPNASASTSRLPSIGSVTSLPRLDTDGKAMDDLIARTNEFSFDLFARMDSNCDIAISPYSVWSTAAIAYPGVMSPAREELIRLFGFHSDPAICGELNARTAARLQTPPDTGNGRLITANAVWIDESCRLTPQFKSSVRSSDRTLIRPVDFARNPSRAREQINHWVRQVTHNRIPKLLDDFDVNERSRIILTNAVTFDGSWCVPFSESETTPRKFFAAKGHPVSLPTMYSDSVFVKYFKADTHELIDIPFQHSDYQFAIILPARSADGVNPTKLPSFRNLDNELAAATWRDAKLSVPKFRVETSLYLERHLKPMGLVKTFEPGAFDQISEGVVLRDIKHVAMIDVHEKGVDAAAATAAFLEGVSEPEAARIVLTIDRPFAYVIRHQPTGIVVFIGAFVGHCGD